MAYLKVGSHRIEVIYHGNFKGSRPVVVLLHQGLGCCALWKDFPQRLYQSLKLPVFAYSRLGHGKSDPCPRPRSVDFMHQEAKTFLPRILSAASIDHYILLGHSDGGSIALIHAGCPGISKGLAALVTEAAHVFCEPMTTGAIARAKAAYEKGALKKQLEKYHGSNTDHAFRNWCDPWLSPAFTQWNIERYLEKIQVKTLALQGTEDEYGSPDQLKRIGKNIHRCDTHMIKGGDHNIHSHPHFLALLEEFMDKPGKPFTQKNLDSTFYS